MDLNYIKKLVKLVEDSNISEIEVEQNELRIKVTKSSQSTVSAVQYVPNIQVPAHPEVIAQPQAAPAQAKVDMTPAPAAPAKKHHEVKSPIVGTYYKSPKPDADAFVKVGDRVTIGQTLCIIEAMKLMNEIEADANGTIVEILIENGRAVEYGQPLFRIDTLG